jgi:hypothetical protein
MFNSASSGAMGHGRYYAITTTVHEQAPSNRARNICNFAVLGFLFGFFFSLFLCSHQYYVYLVAVEMRLSVHLFISYNFDP